MKMGVITLTFIFVVRKGKTSGLQLKCNCLNSHILLCLCTSFILYIMPLELIQDNTARASRENMETFIMIPLGDRKEKYSIVEWKRNGKKFNLHMV